MDEINESVKCRREFIFTCVCEPEKWKRIANSEKRKLCLPKQESYLARYIFWAESNKFLCPCKINPKPNLWTVILKIIEREPCWLWNNTLFALQATYYICLLYGMCVHWISAGRRLWFISFLNLESDYLLSSKSLCRAKEWSLNPRSLLLVEVSAK